jgi:hypothetical protein
MAMQLINFSPKELCLNVKDLWKQFSNATYFQSRSSSLPQSLQVRPYFLEYFAHTRLEQM